MDICYPVCRVVSHAAIPAFTPVKNLLSIIISKDFAIRLNPDKAAAMITKTLFSSRDIFLQREKTQCEHVCVKFSYQIKHFTWRIRPAMPGSSRWAAQLQHRTPWLPKALHEVSVCRCQIGSFGVLLWQRDSALTGSLRCWYNKGHLQLGAWPQGVPAVLALDTLEAPWDSWLLPSHSVPFEWRGVLLQKVLCVLVCNQ